MCVLGLPGVFGWGGPVSDVWEGCHRPRPSHASLGKWAQMTWQAGWLKKVLVHASGQ